MNKIVALLLIGIGVFSNYILKDMTGLVLLLVFAIPLFIVKDNYIC